MGCWLAGIAGGSTGYCQCSYYGHLAGAAVTEAAVTAEHSACDWQCGMWCGGHYGYNSTARKANTSRCRCQDSCWALSQWLLPTAYCPALVDGAGGKNLGLVSDAGAWAEYPWAEHGCCRNPVIITGFFTRVLLLPGGGWLNTLFVLA